MEVGLELNLKTSKYMFMSPSQNAAQNHSRKIAMYGGDSKGEVRS